MSQNVLPMFFSKSFIVSGLQIFNPFRVYFCIWCRKGSNFIHLHLAVQFCQHHLLMKVSFLHSVFLLPLSKIRYPKVCGFISGLSILFLWFAFLFLCQYHTVLMTVVLQYSLKSGRLIPPTPFFFLKIALAWSLFLFPYKL